MIRYPKPEVAKILRPKSYFLDPQFQSREANEIKTKLKKKKKDNINTNPTKHLSSRIRLASSWFIISALSETKNLKVTDVDLMESYYCEVFLYLKLEFWCFLALGPVRRI